MHLTNERSRSSRTKRESLNEETALPAAISDIGLERSVNEDRCAVVQLSSAACYLVFDGMGGVEGGEFAAQLGIDTITRYLQEQDQQQQIDPEEALRGAITAANRVIVLRRQNKAFTQMGTTIVGAIIDESAVVVGHVGDSRAYLIHEDQIRQITVDHTYVQHLVDNQEICKEDALVHPQSHILTQCLGSTSDVKVDTQRFWIWPPERSQRSDLLLLCTDGLYSLVHDDEIAVVVASLPPQQACEELVRIANSRGGYDNITVSIIPLEGCVKDEAPPNWRQEVSRRERARRKKQWWLKPVWEHLLLAGTGAVCAAFATAAAFFIRHVW